MEAGSLGGELDEHRHRAVRLRARLREEAVGDLSLHHDRPEVDARKPSRLSTTIGVATLYGRLATSFRRRFEGREVEAQRVAEAKLDVVSLREPLGQVRLEAAVELDRMHEPDALGEVAGETPRPGPISSTTSSSSSPRVGRSRRGCFRRPGSAAPARGVTGSFTEREDRGGVRGDSLGELRSSSPRTLASSETVTTFAGSFGRPRRACGAR